MTRLCVRFNNYHPIYSHICRDRHHRTYGCNIFICVLHCRMLCRWSTEAVSQMCDLCMQEVKYYHSGKMREFCTLMETEAFICHFNFPTCSDPYVNVNPPCHSTYLWKLYFLQWVKSSYCLLEIVDSSLHVWRGSILMDMTKFHSVHIVNMREHKICI
jgi:hypothetical protein